MMGIICFYGRAANHVAANPDTATTNWVTEEYYCANKGCIAVFVERGKVVKESRSKAKPRITPIRYNEFLALNSPNANPYVFEFRNVGKFSFALLFCLSFFI